MRENILVGNWKMNLNFEEALSVFSEIVHMVKDEKNNQQEVVLCVPFVYINSLQQLSENIIAIGAQNCHQEIGGAFTGEISASMLKSIGCKYVILGHSERRAYFAENNTTLAQKVNTCLHEGLKPIFCIGETLVERENGIHFEIIRHQINEGLFHLNTDDFSKIIIAYEPIWAIGTGKTASPDQAQEIHAFIRKEIAQKYGNDMAENCSILYGGSCNPSNAKAIFAQKDIDGGLIGGASLKARDFVDIIKTLN